MKMSLSENDDSDNETITTVKKIKRRTIVDSDSDEDVGSQLITNTGLVSIENTQSDDSEDDLAVTKTTQVNPALRIKRLVADNDSDSEKENDVVDSIEDAGIDEITESMVLGNEIDETTLRSNCDSPEISKSVCKPKYDPDLYDAEESGDERADESPVKDENLGFDKGGFEEDDDLPKKSVGGKNSKDKKKKKKEKVKSSGEAMREIRKESQRMLRESSCVLPYHRPKQRTLAEFIQRRKSVPSIPLKTSQEHLMRIGKQIEELEKQSEDFFKSDDSESSDEEYVPDYLKNKKSVKSKVDSNTAENTADKNLEFNCSVIAEVSLDKSVNITNSDLLHVDPQSNCNNKNYEDSAAYEKNDVHVLQIQNNDSVTDASVTELLNRVKQRLFDDVNLRSPVSPPPENQVNICDTGNNANKSKDTEEFNFELKINEDSNQIVEPKILNSDSSCENNSNKTESELTPKIVPDKLCVDSEMPCSKLIESSNQNKISSSHSYCFQNSEDFSLRIEDSDQINVDSENINGLTENIDTNKENNKVILDVEDTRTVNESFLRTSEKEDENNKNISSGTEKSQIITTTGCSEIKIPLFGNDLLKNKFHGIDVDLTKVPQLKGNSNEKIHLFSPPKSSAILDLKKRFFQHFTMEKRIKIQEDVEISVITTEVNSDGAVNDIKHEKINAAHNKNEDKWLEDVKEAQLPGAKLARLKAHLEKQLKDRWKEDFNKRVQEYKLNEEENVEEDAKSDYEDEAILDDEDVETDITETESEEELEENDVQLVDKKRSHSKFLDDEADETDGEDQDNVDEEDAIEENEDVLLGNNGSDMDSGNDSDNNEFKSAVRENRKLHSEEDEGSDEDLDEDYCKKVNKSKDVERKKVEKLSASHSEENFSPPATADSQAINKDLHTDDLSSQISSRNSEIFFNSQQEYKSGKFMCIDDLVNATEGIEKLSQSDIMRICSGTFPSQSVALSQLENIDEKLKYSQFNCSPSQSQDLNSTFPDFSQSQQNNFDENLSGKSRKEMNVLKSDDEGDDEIFERSQKNKKHRKIQYSDDEEESNKEDGDNSGDNDSDEEGIENDEEKDEQEDFFVEDVAIRNENDDAEIEYDSEENEIIKDGKSFLDKEAELSESEWGSEDEDEKDLDKFEAEAGDEDELDQDQLKGELGKIHMQRMLVEDKNEVRLLKELLLEDGELHSDESGRVRRFRWANADGDDIGGQSGLLKDSDDEDSDHGDEDENWRRKRHERELYIQKQQEKLRELGIEDAIEEKKDDEENDLLDIGRAMLKKIQKTQIEPKPLSMQKSSKVKVGIGPCGLSSSAAAIKRGSFLKSTDNYLSRLAHITSKVGSDGNVNGPKNSRNFVFSVVSPPKKGQENEETEKKVVKKRKADEKVESSKKKIHFNDELKSSGPRNSLLEILTASN